MTIVIPIQSDLDPTQLYDIILESLPDLIDTVESYDAIAKIDEDEILVKDGEVSDE
jgi:hypothetical protein